MRKANQKNHASEDDDTIISVKELCSRDLKGRIEYMAEGAQLLMIRGLDDFLLAAVISGPEAWLVLGQMTDDNAKQQIQGKVIELAEYRRADCLLTASPAWMAPASNDARPSTHRLRKKVIAVIGKDNYEILGGMQEISESQGKISFGELEVYPAEHSWLDAYRHLTPAKVYY